MTTFGQRLKYLRERAGLTQEELAKKIGISQPAYSYYETPANDRIPTKHLEKLALALDTTVEYLKGVQNYDLSNIPPEMREWIFTKEAVPFLKKAYIEYIQSL